MNLNKKKLLAIKTLGIGKDRIIFNQQRLDEIKEAITKQDIRDLVSAGAISIREIKGQKKAVKRKNRRRAGSIRKSLRPGKRGYVIITRKLRRHIAELHDQEKISKEDYLKIRKQIRTRMFKSKSQLNEHIAGLS